jgi:hypothetical protein
LQDKFEKIMHIRESTVKVSKAISGATTQISYACTDTPTDYKLFTGVTAAGAVMVTVAVIVSATLILR